MQNSIILLQYEDVQLKNRDIDKAGIVNAFFASSLHTDYGLWVSYCSEVEELVCEYGKLQTCVGSAAPCKSLGPGRIHLKTLKALTDIMGKPL